MTEVLLDEVDQALASFRDTYSKYMEYIKYLEGQDPNRLTQRDREILKKHGTKKKKLINPLG